MQKICLFSRFACVIHFFYARNMRKRKNAVNSCVNQKNVVPLQSQRLKHNNNYASRRKTSIK